MWWERNEEGETPVKLPGAPLDIEWRSPWWCGLERAQSSALGLLMLLYSEATSGLLLALGDFWEVTLAQVGSGTQGCRVSCA